MQVGNTNGFEPERFRKLRQATHDHRIADLESPPESAAHGKSEIDVKERD